MQNIKPREVDNIRFYNTVTNRFVYTHPSLMEPARVALDDPVGRSPKDFELQA